MFLQAFFCTFAGSFGPFYVDILRLFCSRRDDRDDVVVDFHEALRNADAVPLAIYFIIERPNTQGGDERCMAGHDAQIAIEGTNEDKIHIFAQYRCIGRDDFQVEFFACFCHALFPFQSLGFFEGFINVPYHVEGLFRHVIAFPGEDFLKAGNGVLQGHIAARLACKLFSNSKRLAQETLDLTGPGDCQLIFFRQFVDTEDGDDILKVVILLQDFLYFTGCLVVIFADDVRVEDTGRGIEARTEPACGAE